MTLKLPLPMKATIGGVKVVIVAAAAYEEQTKAKRVRQSLPAPLPAGTARLPLTPDAIERYIGWKRAYRFSGIMRDAEVARFLLAQLGRTPQHELLLACVDRFGPDRSRSASALNRLSLDVRRWLSETSKGD